MSECYVISGASGFLGTRLVEMLREQNKTVIALGRNEIKGAALHKLGAKFLKSSLNELEKIKSEIPEGANFIHCAALSSPWGKSQDFYESNVLGTRHFAELALSKKARRFIHISTPSIYVDHCSRLSIKESDPLPAQMINDYASSKLEAEKEVEKLGKVGLDYIILRPQGIFGPRDPSILPRLIRVAKKGFIPVIGSEDVQIDLTYVDDVVNAILCACRAPVPSLQQAFNITGGQAINQRKSLLTILGNLGFTVREKKISLRKAEFLARTLELAYRKLPFKGEPLLTRYSVYTLAYSRTLDISRARNLLGYEPKTTFEEGMERYTAWYRQSGF